MDFGVVKVVNGQHKDRLAYYEEDADQDTAVVYFGDPGVSWPYHLAKCILEQASDEEQKKFWSDANMLPEVEESDEV